jgi:heme-degrading monooxygenase HmoA
MVVILFEIEKRPEADSPEYKAALKRMIEIVEATPGYISSEDYMGEDGREISMVRFESLEALEAWRDHPEHLEIQRQARETYYEWYHVEVLTTVSEYSFKHGKGRETIYPQRAKAVEA